MDASSPALIVTYEKKIESLEQEKIILDEKITACGRALPSFNDNFRTAMQFLSNPHKLWASGNLEQQRNVLKLCFGEKLTFDKNEGFRTVSKALPIRVLEGLHNPKSCLVEGAGFEPAYAYAGGVTIRCL